MVKRMSRAIDADALIAKCGNWYVEEGTEEGFISNLKHLIDLQPTIEPEPHWIPCSERLPEDGTECLISVICFKKVTIVDVATYSTDLYKVDKYDFHDKRGVSGWYQLDEEYGYMETLNAIAWMPLPEEYREGES